MLNNQETRNPDAATEIISASPETSGSGLTVLVPLVVGTDVTVD